jgi:hypothetical protein
LTIQNVSAYVPQPFPSELKDFNDRLESLSEIVRATEKRILELEKGSSTWKSFPKTQKSSSETDILYPLNRHSS